MNRGIWGFRSIGVITFVGVIALVCVASPSPMHAQARNTQDVVYLKNGSVIRGIIVEEVPGQSVLIETQDGNRFRYQMTEIERVAKESPVTGTASNAAARKSPGIAWLWSFVIPGAGQLYNGDTGQGIVHLAINFGSYALLWNSWSTEIVCDQSGCFDEDTDTELAIFSVVYLGNWIWSQVDAYQRANEINESLGLGLHLAPRGFAAVDSLQPSLSSRDRAIEVGVRISTNLLR